MLYDRSENERALERFFSAQTDLPPLDGLSAPVTYLIHFSPWDVSILRHSAQKLVEAFLPPDWYNADTVAQVAEEMPATSLGGILKRRLQHVTGNIIVPIHAEDFFACERQGVFRVTAGEKAFNLLGRRLMHEVATSNFIDAGHLEDRLLTDLTSADFEWLFERAFTVSQQRSVVTTYSDAVYSAHVPIVFDTWRREPTQTFARYFKQLSFDFESVEATNPEPIERSAKEKQLANWFADRLRAQTRRWTEQGWPEI